jgi:hypothetical protein
MVGPRIIDADGKEVVVTLMDDSWIMNQCAGMVVPASGKSCENL